MGKKYLIRRKKRLFEADGDAAAQQTQPVAQPAQQTATANDNTANNQQQQQPAQNAANNAQAPQQTNANQAATLADNNQQQNNNQQTTQLSEEQQKVQQQVTECINKIKEIITKADPYQLLAFDMPGVIMEMVPTFKDDQNAKDTQDKWSAFKSNPTQDAFNAVIDAFVKFGNGGQDVQQQQPAAQNQATTEAMFMTFGERLNEKVKIDNKVNQAIISEQNYWKAHPFNF